MADEGGGKPRGDLEQGGDADDLDALAGGLTSLEPGESADAADDADLAAIGALTARSTHASPVPDDAPLVAAAAPAAVLATAASPAPAAKPLPDAAPKARAAWMMPLLVGIGVGIGIAGVTYALSQREVPPAASAETAVPAEVAPVTASAAPAVAPVPSAPPPVVAPAPVAAAPAPAEGERPATGGAQAASAPRTRAAASAAAVAPVPSDEPVLAVKPAEPETPEPDPSAPIAEASPKAALTSGTAPALRGAASMDALLDEALSPEARRNELALRQQAALEANAIPATPNRDQVTQAMTVLLPAIRGCAMGQSGLATAGIVVHSDGRVASVDVAGAPFAGSASGRCMEGVIRRARFPRFTQPSFRIKFPLAIQ